MIPPMSRTALALDIGTCTVTAATRDRDGHIDWVEIDNRSIFDARLVVDEDLKPRPPRPGDPSTVSQLGPVLTRLGAAPTIIEGTAWPFATLLRILLDPIVAAAAARLGVRRIDDVVVVAPQRWTEQEQLAFQLALHTALARHVRMVPSDKAMAFAIPPPPVTQASIVIDAGASALSTAIVAGGPRGPRIVGRNSVDGGGDNFDRMLMANGIIAAGHAEHALGPRWAWVGVPRVREARLLLADADPVTVDLPSPVGQIALVGDAVDATGGAFFEAQLVELLSTKVTAEAGAIRGGHSRALVLCGGLALDPALFAAAHSATGIKPQVIPDPAHALCRGALQFQAAPIDSTNDPDPAQPDPAPRATKDATGSRRKTALYAGGGIGTAAVLIGGALMWSSSVTDAPEMNDTVARQAAVSVLPQSTSLEGLYLKQWTSADGIDDQTLLRSRDTALTLSCGGDAPVADTEKDAVRIQAARVFVVSPSAATPSDRSQFDWAHSGSSVVTDATVLSRASRDEVWRDLEYTNGVCPSTQRNVVRNIVPIPTDGTDPGPPTYAQDRTPIGLPRTTTSAPTSTTVHVNAGVATGKNRLAWRGLISPVQTGTGVALNVTCIASLDNVIVRRACATAETSPEADRLASAAIDAFNPTPAGP